MKPERDIEKNYALPEFVAKLRRLADALENGDSFEIQVGGERIQVPSRAVCSVEHEREGFEEEIEFQLRWENAEAALEQQETEESEEDDDATGQETSERDEAVAQEHAA